MRDLPRIVGIGAHLALTRLWSRLLRQLPASTASCEAESEEEAERTETANRSECAACDEARIRQLPAVLSACRRQGDSPRLPAGRDVNYAALTGLVWRRRQFANVACELGELSAASFVRLHGCVFAGPIACSIVNRCARSLLRCPRSLSRHWNSRGIGISKCEWMTFNRRSDSRIEQLN